jgi:hypothetical protein
MYCQMLLNGATRSRRELTKTNLQPSRHPKSGHWSSAHASSSRRSDHPRATCRCLTAGIRHRPRAMLPPVLNAPQRSSGISRPMQLYRMKEPRLLPKNPKSVTSWDFSFAIRAPAESAYREVHPLDRGTERADEDYRGGGLRGSSEFFTLVQRMSHARSTLPKVTTGPHMQTGQSRLAHDRTKRVRPSCSPLPPIIQVRAVPAGVSVPSCCHGGRQGAGGVGGSAGRGGIS